MWEWVLVTHRWWRLSSGPWTRATVGCFRATETESCYWERSNQPPKTARYLLILFAAACLPTGVILAYHRQRNAHGCWISSVMARTLSVYTFTLCIHALISLPGVDEDIQPLENLLPEHLDQVRVRFLSRVYVILTHKHARIACLDRTNVSIRLWYFISSDSNFSETSWWSKKLGNWGIDISRDQDTFVKLLNRDIKKLFVFVQLFVL